jgi:hypothetical protein
LSRKQVDLQVGDVFTLPIDDERVGYGQIMAPWGGSGGQFYFGIFDRVYPRHDSLDLDAVVVEPLVLLALSLDALLLRGHWGVVGRRQVDSGDVPWPAYKEAVSPPGTFDVVDYTGQRRRRATEGEAERLPFRTVVAPIRVEKALRALNELEPWDDVYAELRPPPDDETSAVLLPE